MRALSGPFDAQTTPYKVLAAGRGKQLRNDDTILAKAHASSALLVLVCEAVLLGVADKRLLVRELSHRHRRPVRSQFSAYQDSTVAS